MEKLAKNKKQVLVPFIGYLQNEVYKHCNLSRKFINYDLKNCIALCIGDMRLGATTLSITTQTIMTLDIKVL